MSDECLCEFDAYDDELEEESFHFLRKCGFCDNEWYSLHCRHDGFQNPCGKCGHKSYPAWKLEILGVASE